VLPEAALETSVAGIFAAGDVMGQAVGSPAHAESALGRRLVERGYSAPHPSIVEEMMVTSPIDDSELRAAEQELARALGASDRIAWVEHYTDDAVFIAPDVPAVRGRTALVEMARSMSPLSSVSIVPLRTDMAGDLAAVYTRASWVTGEGTSERTESSVRGILVWRNDQDGTWRVAQELLHQDPDAQREP
jgi:ketosteroid isomerase-like protein